MSSSRNPSSRTGSRASQRPSEKHISDLLSSALKDLGLPSKRVGRELESAWQQICEPAWGARTRLLRYEGGVLTVGVASAPLRDELASYHAKRIRDLLREALNDVALVAVQFVADGAGSGPGRPPQ